MDYVAVTENSKTDMLPFSSRKWKGYNQILLEEGKLTAFPSSRNIQMWVAEITGISDSYVFERHYLNSKKVWGKTYKNNRISSSAPVEITWALEDNVIYEVAGNKTASNQMRMFFMIEGSIIKILDPKNILEYYDSISEEPFLSLLEGKRFSEMTDKERMFSAYLK